MILGSDAREQITVKLPVMPAAEMEAATSEAMAAVEGIMERLADGRASAPAVLVVADERYPMLPALEELGEFAAVFYYDRSPDADGRVVHVR